MKKQICQPSFIYFAGLVSTLLLFNGCTGAHFHNPNNNQIAINANENFEKIVKEVDTEFIKENENLAKLLNEDIEAVARLAKGTRDGAAAIIATSDKTLKEVWLGDKSILLGRRLNDIGVNAEIRNEFGKENGIKWTKMVSSLNFSQKEIITKKELEELHYLGPFLCELDKVSEINNDVLNNAIEATLKDFPSPPIPTKEDIKNRIEDLYLTYTNKCKENRGGIPVFEASFNEGEFLKTRTEMLTAIQSKENARIIQLKIQQEFDSAKEKLKNTKQADQKPSKIINEQISRVGKIIQAANGFERLSAEKEVTEKRLDNINCIFAGLAKESESTPEEGTAAGETPATDKINGCKLNSDEQRAALVLAGLPNLTDGFYNLAQIINKPPLTALMMAKGELEARLDAIKAQVMREEAKIQLVETKYQALVEEVNNYNRVNLFVKQAIKPGNPLSTTYKKYTKGKSSESKRAIKAAIALQIFAQTNSLKKRYQAEYGLIALEYQANQEISKARVAQWYAMLRPLILQQEAYHKSGVTEDQIANIAVEILKAAALFTIAGGI